MTPTQAGWTDTLAPDAPAFCPGSGQVAIFATPGEAVPCPACPRMVRVTIHGEPPADRAATIADHEPPADVAPTISLGL